MKYFQSLIILTIISLSISLESSAQDYPLWRKLKAGNYNVGYQAFHKEARSGVFMKRSFDGKINQASGRALFMEAAVTKTLSENSSSASFAGENKP